MGKNEYSVNYLPLAINDIKVISDYIANNIGMPRTAEKLVKKIYKKAELLKENPYRFHIYMSPIKLKYKYRVLSVDNYSLFFVVEGKKVEIFRAIYSKRNIAKILSEDELKDRK